ncbi:MAG: GTPase ObgE [Spirochaetaceae bacterium]|nr:MAG: GTPase ObgE [Spirochaetaceae bacterium]
MERGTLNRFVDQTDIEVTSGDGGPGCVSFLRERYRPRGGPDGGDGGRGGDAVFVVRSNLKTLSQLTMQRRYAAENGRPGEGKNRHGRDGASVEIAVPPGTLLKDSETGELLADLTNEGDRLVLLKGGRGGKGNTHFKSSTHQTPRLAQPGEPGETRVIRVELSLIADIGFVGIPNAGKSSLLAALTRARPRVANYPFTTTIPNLGVVEYDDKQLVLADIPGLIEGASQGAGLGTVFLRHVSRSAALAFVLDLEREDTAEQFALLQRELASAYPELATRTRIVVANKIDLDLDGESLASLRRALPAEWVCGVSAATREGIPELVRAFLQLVSPEAQGEQV